ncbi:hypothetical protein GCM10009661_79430 [Catellatospora chokoriensis]|uniref:Uncharacterized protein n=1 Tax=Catellatospora chokoriensis TaxID=310353 RepID=A0A8J3K0E8_9ACTN|nr:hypothetical protein Cch02nite_05080 [Catellatospora chokoriensis]
MPAAGSAWSKGNGVFRHQARVEVWQGGRVSEPTCTDGRGAACAPAAGTVSAAAANSSAARSLMVDRGGVAAAETDWGLSDMGHMVR